LITALLAFARPVHISPVRVPISELFERAVSATGETMSAKRVRVERPAERELDAIDVNVDPDLMTQVLVGLVANAIDAVGVGGEIRLEAHPNGRQIELAVADTGPGVPAELRSQVFEPFFTTRAEGIGLGLAIARQIVEAHGGRIEVGQSESGGARFAVILPAAGSATTAAA
jgi:signal transduction histidine kinase